MGGAQVESFIRSAIVLRMQGKDSNYIILVWVAISLFLSPLSQHLTCTNFSLHLANILLAGILHHKY